MINRIFFSFFLFLSLVSCKRSESNSLNIKSPPIDFNSVDAYPLLPECEKYTSRVAQKKCFYKLISKRIELSLNEKEITFNNATNDTIKVTIHVNEKGLVSVKNMNIDNNKAFKNTVIESIKSLPIIQPATKSGIPVKTEFILPIILQQSKLD